MSGHAYGFGTKLRDVAFDDIVTRVVEALEAEGFGVLTEIDVQKTLKEKLDVEFRRYRILGACAPPLAKQALEAEPEIGLLLPCNVVVQDADGGEVAVSVIDPKAMFELVENDGVQPIAEEVEARLRRVVAALG